MAAKQSRFSAAPSAGNTSSSAPSLQLIPDRPGDGKQNKKFKIIWPEGDTYSVKARRTLQFIIWERRISSDEGELARPTWVSSVPNTSAERDDFVRDDWMLRDRRENIARKHSDDSRGVYEICVEVLEGDRVVLRSNVVRYRYTGERASAHQGRNTGDAMPNTQTPSVLAQAAVPQNPPSSADSLSLENLQLAEHYIAQDAMISALFVREVVNVTGLEALDKYFQTLANSEQEKARESLEPVIREAKTALARVLAASDAEVMQKWVPERHLMMLYMALQGQPQGYQICYDTSYKATQAMLRAARAASEQVPSAGAVGLRIVDLFKYPDMVAPWIWNSVRKNSFLRVLAWVDDNTKGDIQIEIGLAVGVHYDEVMIEGFGVALCAGLDYGAQCEGRRISSRYERLTDQESELIKRFHLFWSPETGADR